MSTALVIALLLAVTSDHVGSILVFPSVGLAETLLAERSAADLLVDAVGTARK